MSLNLGTSHRIKSARCRDPQRHQRVLNSNSNDSPERASRPMSGTAAGFIPGSGSGVIVLEELECALDRGARIYAELLTASVNCGGQRGGGSMTAPNKESVRRCIRTSLEAARLDASQISLINGHLTGTMGDVIEINNWAEALEVEPSKLPCIQSTKSMIGHCLGGAGGIETVALLLELCGGFVHGSLNCEDLHPMLESFAGSIPHKTVTRELSIGAKTSFGFGDVNGCLIFKRWG